MSADNLAALVVACVSGFAAIVTLAVAVVLGRRVRELRETLRHLQGDAVPLVRDARVVMDQAATEMVRVGDVLSSAEAVSGTVDSASRLTYRMFANPVVKALAFGTGARGAVRRLVSPRPASARRGPSVRAQPARPSTSAPGPTRHRGRRDLVRQ